MKKTTIEDYMKTTKTVTIQVTDRQARLISHSLEFYARIGLGQFNYIRENYSIQKYLMDNKRDERRNIAKEEITIARNKLFDTDTGLDLHSEKIDESVRVAIDIRQVIQHEFWKNKSGFPFTVDSSIHFTSNDADVKKVKCKIN